MCRGLKPQKNNFQILNHQYALLTLLGKGGFSKVYKVRTSASIHLIIEILTFACLMKIHIYHVKSIDHSVANIGNCKIMYFCSDLK
jgi:hypothetical protein